MSNETSLLRRRDVEARVGLSRSTIYAEIKHGRFPPPVKISPQAVRWRSDEVDAWIAKRTAERDGGAADA